METVTCPPGSELPGTPIDPVAYGARTVPTGPYYRRDWFEWEVEAIFRREWLHIAHVSELRRPGDFIVREIDSCKASVLIVRGKDDVIRAFHNVCPHRGTLLVSGRREGNAPVFTCRYHGWTFERDGALRAAPDFETFGLDKADCGLQPISVESHAGLIFINLDPQPRQTLAEHLGPAWDSLPHHAAATATHFSEYVYEIEGNWKLVYDNFQETYHLRFIHPRTVGASTSPEGNFFGYAETFATFGPHRAMLLPVNPEHRPAPTAARGFGKVMEAAMEREADMGPWLRHYLCMFPDTYLLLGRANPFTHTIVPISETRTRGFVRLYWNGSDANATERFAREFAMVATRDIHSEDVSVIEDGQRGILSRAFDRINFQRNELFCHYLFAQVEQRVLAWLAEQGRPDAAAQALELRR